VTILLRRAGGSSHKGPEMRLHNRAFMRSLTPTRGEWSPTLPPTDHFEGYGNLMPFYAAIAQREGDYWIGWLIETVFETEEAARSIETIKRGLDWRWHPGNASWLDGRTLRHHRYRAPSATWDHDHCEFCWQKFMDASDSANKAEWFASGELAAVGYATVAFDNRADDYHWVCEKCFHDFDPFFHWTVIEGERGEEHE